MIRFWNGFTDSPLGRGGVPCNDGWKPPTRLEPWEELFSDPTRRLPQYPQVAARAANRTTAIWQPQRAVSTHPFCQSNSLLVIGFRWFPDLGNPAH
jgi:hypothetical protein